MIPASTSQFLFNIFIAVTFQFLGHRAPNPLLTALRAAQAPIPVLLISFSSCHKIRPSRAHQSCNDVRAPGSPGQELRTGGWG